ncbi:hypothetical protein MSIMFI_01835 [Mycobacterium simulans]|nr:hypothetical protein MSIMFI_01835 [Mycobacterium simulans]
MRPQHQPPLESAVQSVTANTQSCGKVQHCRCRALFVAATSRAILGTAFAVPAASDAISVIASNIRLSSAAIAGLSNPAPT